MAVNVVLKSIFDDTGVKMAEKEFANFGKTIDKAFKAVAVVTAAAGAALLKFGSESVKAASNLEESTNAVNVSFGEAASAILKIGESSAESLGLARSEFNQAAVRFSAFAEKVVGAGGDVAGFIKNITQRAADFASVFNIDVAEALRVFQSGLAGEAEPLKRFGINLLESEVKAYALRAGIISVGQSMTETEKVQARYGLLMEATNKTAGDFANTSDGLANTQRILTARFTDLQAEVGEALLPAVTDLVGALADELIPVFEELGEFLRSPQGKKVIEDTATAIKNLITFVADNLFTIIDFAIKIGAAITALKLLKGALELATVAQTLFNAAVASNPFVRAAAAIAAGVSAIAIAYALVGDKAEKVKTELEQQGSTVVRTRGGYVKFAKDVTDSGKAMTYSVNKTTKAIEAAELAAKGVNNVSLAKFRTQLGDTRVEAEKLTNAQRQLYYAMLGLPIPDLPTPTPTPILDPAGTPQESAFARVQKIIKDTQKKLAEAQKDYDKAVSQAQTAYNKTVADASERYAESIADAETRKGESLAAALKAHTQNISKIQDDFAKRQADIITRSIDRLRDAYASAVRVNVADLFGTETVGKSIDNLITNLRDRLNASRTLVSNAALLASSGFSQTFIEQIVGAGLDTGNELSKAILEATPETQRELQSLFSALESESETGMDSVAKTIFDKTGLATTELKKLFAQTQTDLVEALKQAELDYTESQSQILKTFDDAMLQAQKTRDEAFENANERLQEALSEARDAYIETVEAIKAAFLEQIEALEGALGGLGKTVEQLIALMNNLLMGTQGPIKADFPTISNGEIASSVEGLFPSIPGTTGPGGGGGNRGGILQPLSAININVSVDPTQSPAMVGAAVARSINKYTGGGGGLRGIGVIPV